MVVGGCANVSKVQLKRHSDNLSHDLYNIDLQIQNLKQQGDRQWEIKRLEQANLQVQKQVVTKQVELEIRNAQMRRGK